MKCSILQQFYTEFTFIIIRAAEILPASCLCAKQFSASALKSILFESKYSQLLPKTHVKKRIRWSHSSDVKNSLRKVCATSSFHSFKWLRSECCNFGQANPPKRWAIFTCIFRKSSLHLCSRFSRKVSWDLGKLRKKICVQSAVKLL